MTTSVSTTSAPAAGLVAALRSVFAEGFTAELRWRTEQLRGLQRLLVEQEDAIVEALASDLGRPPPEAWLGDIASTQAEVAYALKHLKKWMRRRRASVPLTQLPARAWVQYEPLGVVLVI